MFMLDMDELVYQFGLSERWRTRMESTGRVELDDVEADRLARTKVVHVVLITLLGLAFVYAAGPFRRPERKTPAEPSLHPSPPNKAACAQTVLRGTSFSHWRSELEGP